MSDEITLISTPDPDWTPTGQFWMPPADPLFRQPVPWNEHCHAEAKWWPKRYRQYQKSPEWNVVEAFLFQFFDYCCIDCDDEVAEVMHHLPVGYRHLGKELPGEHVVALCLDCHARRHGKLDEAA